MRGILLAAFLAACAASPAPVVSQTALTTIRVEWSSWGRPLGGWSITRGGEGTFTEGESTATFAVSDELFGRVRDALSPYEGQAFECRRVITDLPYGQLVWTSVGGGEQSIRFDSGCTSGDADAMFDRLERAQTLVQAARDAGQ